MKTEEMIDVLSAHVRGELIECRGSSLDFAHDAWEVVHHPSHVWDFRNFVYRVAKPEPKKVKMWQWIGKGKSGYFLSGNFFPEKPQRDEYCEWIGRAGWTMIEVEV